VLLSHEAGRERERERERERQRQTHTETEEEQKDGQKNVFVAVFIHDFYPSCSTVRRIWKDAVDEDVLCRARRVCQVTYVMSRGAFCRRRALSLSLSLAKMKEQRLVSIVHHTFTVRKGLLSWFLLFFFFFSFFSVFVLRRSIFFFFFFFVFFLVL
jgi:hypothetical protein